MLIGTPAILRNVNTVRKRTSVTSLPCCSFVFITQFLSHKHKYVRMSNEIDLLYEHFHVSYSAHPDVCQAVAMAFNWSAQGSLQHFCTGLPELRPTVCRALFMRHEVDCRLLVPTAFAWVKRAGSLLGEPMAVTWKVLCNLLEKLFSKRHGEVVTLWIHAINRVSHPLLEELCIFTEYVILVKLRVRDLPIDPAIVYVLFHTARSKEVISTQCLYFHNT
jgi:hypothetical protein